MTQRPCHLCASNDVRTVLTGPPQVLRCENCRLVFLATFPSDDERVSYYQQEYYEEGSGERFVGFLEGLVCWFRERRTRDLLRRLPGPRPEGGSDERRDALLDVGCGRGLLLDCFRRLGWDVTGTQLSRTARAAGEERHGVTVHLGELPELGLPDTAFRVVTLYHVLEHVDRPVEYLREIHRLLRVDGLLAVEVPDMGSPGSRLLGVRSFCFDYPHHLFFFTTATLRRVLEEVGFEVIGVSHFSLEYSIYTTLQNILNVLPGEANRLYRSLLRNADGRRLRRQPLTWAHAGLGALLSLPALFVSLAGLVAPVGNTVTFYCRRREATAAAVATTQPTVVSS